MSRENNSNQLKMQKNYFAKIAYHMFKGNEKQINYFVKRQEQTCGPITYYQLDMIEDMVDGLHVDAAAAQAEEARGFGINELYI